MRAKRGVDGAGERVGDRRLALPDRHDRTAMVRPEIRRQRPDPVCVTLRVPALTGAGQFAGERGQKPGNLAGAGAQAMIGRHAGDRDQAVDGVQPVHPVRWLPDAAAIGELTRVAQRERALGQQVVVGGEDHVSAGQIENRLEGPAESSADPIGRVRRHERRVRVHGGGRVALAHAIHERVDQRRGGGFEQEVQAGAVRPRDAPQLAILECALHVEPGGRHAAAHHEPAAIGIVELQHGGLLEHAGRAERRRDGPCCPPP